MDLDRSAAHIERALELDPLNLLIKIRQGFVLIFRRDQRSLEKALELFKEIVEFEPSFALGHLSVMTVYAAMGNFREAIVWGEKGLDIAPRIVAYLGNLGWIYAAAGRKDKAREILAELLERSKKGYVSSFWISILCISLGEIDEAFTWLDRAYEERDGSLIYATVPPLFDPIRSDTRYKRLLEKMGLGHLWEKLLPYSSV
jgi:serine/threonine-protein kinase